MRTIKIRTPYYGAGSPKKYNWVRDGLNIQGIGINLVYLKTNNEIRIIFDNILYQVKTALLIDFIKKYHSTCRIKNSDVTVGVFSTSLLTEI